MLIVCIENVLFCALMCFAKMNHFKGLNQPVIKLLHCLPLDDQVQNIAKNSL